MIELIKGNLFDTNVNALAHGCNCGGQMGKGIALEFARRWPQMYEEYQELCWDKQIRPGHMFVYVQGEKVIFNLMTQFRPYVPAGPDAIKFSLDHMREYADDKGINKIAMPKIGCGLGGLKWNQVELVVQEVFGGWPGTLSVYYLEEDK